MASSVRYPVKLKTSTRTAVAKASEGGPDLGTWLNRIRALDVPVLTEAISGIWCGRNGHETIDLPGCSGMLVVSWYNGRVETSYVS